jgi:antitoxin (DNA-binding transcriptional repressor) of toxin-antitoxin stability system
MSHQVVSATNLARNFSEFLNRVRYQGVTLDVTRGSDVIACISPPSPAGGFPIAQLDRLFASLPQLTAEEAAQFANDVTAVVGNLQPERDAWAS